MTCLFLALIFGDHFKFIPLFLFPVQNGVYSDVPTGIGNFCILATICIYGQYSRDPFPRGIVFWKRNFHYILAKDGRVVIIGGYVSYPDVGGSLLS
uniref:Uncharacterized protein n=1 Tax=Periophthalmus magnuspinnatus TaxID=409849 RepID=A0A3B4BG95_9GOBI